MRKPHLAAPGVNVVSTSASGPPWGYGNNYTGTSFATPHVAGLAALILDAEPDLLPREVCWKMALTAIDLGDPGADNEYGWGLIQCLPAIQYPREMTPAIACPAGCGPQEGQ